MPNHAAMIQGFRVEPAESEAVLRGFPDIRNVAVVVRSTGDGATGDGERRLVAFYEADAAIPSGDLRRRLAEKLPPYLVPATFTWLSGLPLTGNGKVDRAALAGRSSRDRPELSSRHRPPEGPVEAWLTELWQEVMEVDRIGVDDDFFELGGHSLMATRITGEIAAEFGTFITARKFYENPTIVELAREIAAARPSGDGFVETAATP